VSYIAARDPNSAKILVTVDGIQTVVDPSEGTSKSDTQVPPVDIVYTGTGLKEDQEHTISIQFSAVGSQGGSYVELYGFAYVTVTITSHQQLTR
jgi:hypothetical protein